MEERTAPSPDVLKKPVRRRFAVEYKVRTLAETDACTEMGQLGELLRCEGLYSSHLSNWRRQRDEGVLAGLTPKRRDRKSKPKNLLADENEHLRRENHRLKEKLRQAELIIDVQKKSPKYWAFPSRARVLTTRSFSTRITLSRLEREKNRSRSLDNAIVFNENNTLPP